ncbi:hypothetical protein [Polyangium jinanense]|uniref:Uncharacterized protein n=1 Tax=Polyangium jinanense TaxID=2829994 RepID=A0A9X3XE82_9BACT|nr:hypothetical protein [Polyangium jinanense]MDC3988682.1 hypothetical protein [Polyangium jinanense]
MAKPKIDMRQEPMPWGRGQMSLRPPEQVAGREKSLQELIRNAAGAGRLRRYQATVGVTTAAIVPEGEAYTLWDKGTYVHTYGVPVGVKQDGSWRHPAGPGWTQEICALLEAAPFVGKPGG